MKTKTRRGGYSLDRLMKSLYRNLVSDFKPYLEAECDWESVKKLNNMKLFREHVFDTKRMYRDVSCFKRSYQLESLFKRYRFSCDKYTTSDLEELTTNKFVETQQRLKRLPDTFETTRVRRVLDAAASHVSRILGDFDEEEHITACKFGRRAAVGHPSSKRFLDLKVAGPLTGSEEHIAWFKNLLKQPENYLLRDVLSESDKSVDLEDRFCVCDTLTLVNVAKSFKALRSILPNTLIGGFYSYGLGKVIQAKLLDEGLNIKRLQEKHRRVIKVFSKTRTHVTADLSSASDSFTERLVNRLVPHTWFEALNLGRISKVKLKNGETIEMESFMTMGIGFTFQLQTLLFYALLRGVQDCLGDEGFISVYGDDLIYPIRLHPYVSQIFNDLGFLLNEDKTFVTENFRESCGSDCYCGFDVRPFQPEGQSQTLSRKRYVCFLYKTINGLLERWNEFEVEKTLNFLYAEILHIDHILLQVPPSFPSYSGVRTHTIKTTEQWFIPWSKVSIGGRYQNYRFPAYAAVSEKRPVLRVYGYYWLVLHDRALPPDYDFSPYEDGSEEILDWIPMNCPKWRSEWSGQQFAYKLRAHVSSGRYNLINQVCQAVAWN